MSNPTKWSNTLKQFVDNFPTNCLSVFDHFMGMVLKGLILSKTTVNENVFTKGKYFKMKIMLQEHHLESTLNSCTKIDRAQRK